MKLSDIDCVARCNCASGVLDAYVCHESQLSEDVEASCVSYGYTAMIHSQFCCAMTIN